MIGGSRAADRQFIEGAVIICIGQLPVGIISALAGSNVVNECYVGITEFSQKRSKRTLKDMAFGRFVSLETIGSISDAAQPVSALKETVLS